MGFGIDNATMNHRNVIIIGAGPAGLAAALSALKEGASVIVLEHMEEPAKKLLLTGNGQCNLSNTEVGPSHYHGNKAVIENVLNSFSYDDMISFMNSLSVETETCRYRFENCGYLYPRTHDSATVRNNMLKSISDRKGRIINGCQISNISINDIQQSYLVETNMGNFNADSLIFATGSNAYPKTGSDSSIYPLLKKLGIIQKKWLPALTAIKSASHELRSLSGLRADAELTLFDLDSNEKYMTPMGEVQFRDHYISGIPALQLSRYVAIGIDKSHKMLLFIKILKANNKDGILPYSDLKINLTGTEGFERSICCSGGINENDIVPETLECSKFRHMYFAGEMIDVDGDCGGFNLHFAIGSGMIAGRNAAL